MKYKQCSKCKEIKVLSEFNTRPDRKSGYRSECKKCQYHTQALRKRKINPERARAYCKLQYAKRRGEIIKSNNCEECGTDENIQGHHKDYSLPYNVNWLCAKCHAKLHRQMKI